MFKSIYIHNYKCIKDLTVDFTYDQKKAPKGYKSFSNHVFFQTGPRICDRIVPVYSIYGANASGKTTVIKAVYLLRKLVMGGVKNVKYLPNLITTFKQEADRTTISADFFCNKKLCNIKISFNSTSILHEELNINGINIYSVIDSKIRQLSEELSKYSGALNDLFKNQCINALNHKQENALLPKIRNNFPGISKDVIAICDYIEHDVFVLMKDDPLPYSLLLDGLSSTYVDVPQIDRKNKALEVLVEVLNKLDVGITKLSIENKSIEEYLSSRQGNVRNVPLSYITQRIFHSLSNNEPLFADIVPYHDNVKGQKIEFDFDEESSGTKRLIQLILLFLYSLRSGKDLFIDELDDSLHPLLLKEIVRMFKLKSFNIKSSQLIFNLHNTDLLSDDLLSPSEIAMLSYTKQNGSMLYRLSSSKVSKNSANFQKDYLRGDFGGIPFPYV